MLIMYCDCQGKGTFVVLNKHSNAWQWLMFWWLQMSNPSSGPSVMVATSNKVIRPCQQKQSLPRQTVPRWSHHRIKCTAALTFKKLTEQKKEYSTTFRCPRNDLIHYRIISVTWNIFFVFDPIFCWYMHTW